MGGGATLTGKPTITPAAAAPSLPAPATTEAIELGCTCRVIAHASATNEGEPAGVLIAPDANCPLHGTAAQQETTT
jgi:hypothetical protein